MRLLLSSKGWGAQCAPSRDYPPSQKAAKWSSSTATAGTRVPSWPWGDSLPQMPAVRSRGLGSQNPLLWHRENLFGDRGWGCFSFHREGETPWDGWSPFPFLSHTHSWVSWHIHVQGCWRDDDDEAGAVSKEQPLCHRQHLQQIQEAENSTSSPQLNPAGIRVRALVGQGMGPRRPLEKFAAVVGTMATSANAKHGQKLGGTNYPRFSPGTSLRTPRQRGRGLCCGSVCQIHPWGGEES